MKSNLYFCVVTANKHWNKGKSLRKMYMFVFMRKTVINNE